MCEGSRAGNARELFSPSVGCADSSLVRGSLEAGTPGEAGKRELFSPSVGCADSSLVRGSKGCGAGSMRKPGAFLSLSRLH